MDDNNNNANNDSVNISDSSKDRFKNDSVTPDNVKLNKSGLPKQTPGVKPIFDRVTPELLDDLEGYASQDVPNYQIAKTLGMALSSFYKLMNESPEFKAAYNSGLESRKYEIEKALFRRATGFTAQETKTETDAEGNIIKTTVTDKNYVPDSIAAMFTLKNLMPDKYKDRIESVNTVNINVNQIQNLPDEELLKYANVDLIDVDDYSIE